MLPPQPQANLPRCSVGMSKTEYDRIRALADKYGFTMTKTVIALLNFYELYEKRGAVAPLAP
jgi:hypothetical protein